MNNGKRKCEFLREIRRKVAEQYGLHYEPRECHHEGDCQGTCPLCDAELEELQNQLQKKGIDEVSFNESLNKDSDEFYSNQPESTDDDDEMMVLQGDVCAPPDPESVLGKMTGPPIPPFENEFSLPFMECTVAGVQFHDVDDVWDELDEGLVVKLEREYDNVHDANAIQVILSSSEFGDSDDEIEEYILGYIPQKQNKTIATILDMGWKDVFTASISELRLTSNGSKIIKISIDVQNINCVEKTKNENLYRAQYLDKQGYNDLCKSLYEKGHVYFRWGGYPPWEKDLPVEREKVFFIHKQDKDAVIYLMKVIAVGDNCLPFVDSIDDLQMSDDCNAYILTNIKGPITLSKKAIKFLDNELISDWQPDVPMSKESAYRLKSLL